MSDSIDSTDIADVIREGLISLTREQILEAEDLTVEPVDVPEWGGTLWVRTMNGDERDDFEARISSSNGKNQDVNLRGLRARLVALTACTEDGTPLFTASDVKALGTKSAAALTRVFEVAASINRLSREEAEKMAESFPEESEGGI